MEDVTVLYTTWPDAETAVKARLAARVNILARSVRTATFARRGQAAAAM